MAELTNEFHHNGGGVVAAGAIESLIDELLGGCDDYVRAAEYFFEVMIPKAVGYAISHEEETVPGLTGNSTDLRFDELMAATEGLIHDIPARVGACLTFI